MSDRRGSANPFFGKRHTPEWKAAATARMTQWTGADALAVRRWYADHEGVPLRLADLAASLGRTKPAVCKFARQLGITHASRKTGRKPTNKHATIADARAASAQAARERIAKNGHPRGMLGKKQNPEHVARLAQMTRDRYAAMTPEEQERLTDKTQATLMAKYGTLSPGTMRGSNPYSRTKYGRRADLNNQFFRSSWEANYARYLNLIGASWEFEAETFWFENIRRGVRSYTPDFRITEPDGSVYFVEVKGWMDPKSKTKTKRMAKYHPTVDLRVVDQKAYREIERKMSGAIPHWERAA